MWIWIWVWVWIRVWIWIRILATAIVEDLVNSMDFVVYFEMAGIIQYSEGQVVYGSRVYICLVLLVGSFK